MRQPWCEVQANRWQQLLRRGLTSFKQFDMPCGIIKEHCAATYMKTRNLSVHLKSPPLSAVCILSPMLLALACSAQTGQYLYTGSVTNITLNPGLYAITAYGAQGGNAQLSSGGLGAEMGAKFSITTPTTLTLLVG